MYYFPWFWLIPWIMGGFHPGSFRVIIKDKKRGYIKYQITGGGLFLISDSLDIKEIKTLKTYNNSVHKNA
jgi:hypothetical protein